MIRHLFLGWSLVIKAIQCKDENENLVPPQENSLYHRVMVGPSVRLIIESLIKVSYIYCAPNDEIKKERLNKLTDTFAIEYKKLLKYLWSGLDKSQTIKKYILLDIVFCEYKYLHPFTYNFLAKSDIYIKLDIVK